MVGVGGYCLPCQYHTACLPRGLPGCDRPLDTLPRPTKNTQRTHLLRYLRHVAAALDQARGGIFVADLLGGPAAERDLTLPRHNSTTGLGYTWLQSGFDPVTRRMTGTIRLREMDGREARRYNFHYDWRMWTVPDVRELLRQAGFSTTYVWIRPIKVESVCWRGGGLRGGAP